MTSTTDAESVAAYLKTKPAGATRDEAGAVLDSKLLDGRKLSGYEAWGIIEEENGRLKLTDRGRRLARQADAAPTIYREVVGSVPAYRSVMEWAHHQDFSEVSVDDAGAHLHAHHSPALGTDNEKSIRAAVTCFFDLCQGAGLGQYVKGRRGQPTRLQLDREALRDFIEEGPQVPPWSRDSDDDSEFGEGDGERQGEEPAFESESGVEPESLVDVSRPEMSTDAMRVFITHGKNVDVVDQVKTILDLADIEYEVAVEEETAAIPVPEKVMQAMRRCRAGVLCVTAEEGRTDEAGNYVPNENVLIEIGAAFVLYEQRVVLLWDRRLEVPSNLQGLYRCEFEGDELSWTAGTKLMKAIQGFKK